MATSPLKTQAEAREALRKIHMCLSEVNLGHLPTDFFYQEGYGWSPVVAHTPVAAERQMVWKAFFLVGFHNIACWECWNENIGRIPNASGAVCDHEVGFHG